MLGYFIGLYLTPGGLGVMLWISVTGTFHAVKFKIAELIKWTNNE